MTNATVNVNNLSFTCTGRIITSIRIFFRDFEILGDFSFQLLNANLQIPNISVAAKQLNDEAFIVPYSCRTQNVIFNADFDISLDKTNVSLAVANIALKLLKSLFKNKLFAQVQSQVQFLINNLINQKLEQF